MLAVKAFLVLTALLLIPLGICVVVVRVARYVADRLALRFKSTKWTKTVANGIGALVSTSVLLIVVLGLIVAFGAVANADASAKATMLAKGIAEALDCTPFAVVGAGAIVGVVSLLVLTRPRPRPPAH